MTQENKSTRSNIQVLRRGDYVRSTIGALGLLNHQEVYLDNALGMYLPSFEYTKKVASKERIEWLEKKIEGISNSPEKTLEELANYVIETTQCDNKNLWPEYQTKGIALSDCIEKKVITCFHRAIFCNLVLQGIGEQYLQPLVLEGFWYQDDKSEAHLWNRVLLPQQKRIFLVDSAFLDPNRNPIIADITNQNEKKVRVSLSNGGAREYCESGSIILNFGSI